MIKLFCFLCRVLLLSLFLGACTTVVQNTNYHWQSWSLRAKTAQRLHVWQANGVFSLLQSGKRPIIASYLWKQDGASYLIWLHGALNFYSIFIKGSPGNTTLWRSSRDYVTASNPEQLMQKELGWQLPISDLYYWFRGLPSPQAFNLKFDAYGHLAQFRTDFATIQLLHYQNTSTADLPGEILVKGIKGRSFQMKIIIKAWHVS